MTEDSQLFQSLANSAERSTALFRPPARKPKRTAHNNPGATDMILAYISHEDCKRHEMGAHHVEVPERLHAISDRMIAAGIEMLVHPL
jgi:hypothetical protein